MPVFVNEVVITGEVAGGDRPRPNAVPEAAPAPLDAGARARLVEEIAAEVFRRLERALDRMTER